MSATVAQAASPITSVVVTALGQSALSARLENVSNAPGAAAGRGPPTLAVGLSIVSPAAWNGGAAMGFEALPGSGWPVVGACSASATKCASG